MFLEDRSIFLIPQWFSLFRETLGIRKEKECSKEIENQMVIMKKQERLKISMQQVLRFSQLVFTISCSETVDSIRLLTVEKKRQHSAYCFTSCYCLKLHQVASTISTTIQTSHILISSSSHSSQICTATCFHCNAVIGQVITLGSEQPGWVNPRCHTHLGGLLAIFISLHRHLSN